MVIYIPITSWLYSPFLLFRGVEEGRRSLDVFYSPVHVLFKGVQANPDSEDTAQRRADDKKVIQIALNIGQFRGMSGGKYPAYGIAINSIALFLRKKDIVALSAHIPDETMEKMEEYLKTYN